jgi:tetratricopeptide (TPR) repeat protein
VRDAARKISVSQLYYTSGLHEDSAGAFMSRWAVRAAAIGLVIVFLIAAAFSIRLAWADIEFRRGTEESVARAMRILPDNVQYLLFHALQMEYAGADSTAELERAAKLSPMSSAPRLRLGLAAEARGDYKAAEKWLLEAARVDHQFEPGWALANFYFRQGRTNEFWLWMHSALDVSYGDRRSAFDLCWRAGKDAKEILQRGVPRRREVLVAMLIYVLEKHRQDAAAVAAELAKFHNPGDELLLDAACTAVIESGDADAAARLWSAVGHTSAGGVWNGNFAGVPDGEGFDWSIEKPAGVTQVHLNGRGHRIEFSGRQPETARLLRQIVLLDPHRRYRLEWSALVHGFPEVTGLSWTLGGQRIPLKPSEDEQNDRAIVAAERRLTPLELWYQRPAGQVRAEGWVELRAVSLTLMP